jgi:hypothetical protein
MLIYDDGNFPFCSFLCEDNSLGLLIENVLDFEPDLLAKSVYFMLWEYPNEAYFNWDRFFRWFWEI